MPNYQKGKIYKIIDNKTGKVYFGSTTEPTIARRLATHRTHCKQYKEGKQRNCSSFEILENNDYVIVLVELFSCSSKDELLARERYWIENNECINKNRPIVSIEEKKQYQQQYYQEHFIEHKDKRTKYKQQYNQEHKEENQQYSQQYYQNNKKEINQQRLQIITCECGRSVCIGHLTRHKKSKIHNELITTLQYNSY